MTCTSRTGDPGAQRVTRVGIASASVTSNRPGSTSSKVKREVMPSNVSGWLGICWAIWFPRPYTTHVSPIRVQGCTVCAWCP